MTVAVLLVVGNQSAIRSMTVAVLLVAGTVMAGISNRTATVMERIICELAGASQKLCLRLESNFRAVRMSDK